ncbi:MAG: aconitase family protein [Thermoanaerobaculia bacterium]|nr:aconitase family protein [Thermoanaerobaculia bacterium]
MKPPVEFRLQPGRRVLFLTKDPDLIRRQLTGELDLQMADLSIEDLLDDINTDVMTPAWVCFRHRPADIARDAYAGLIVEGERLIPTDALQKGGFEVIVSGYRKGTGSSRETAVQAEKWSGIKLAVAASFAPIHARNNINQGVLMGNHGMLRRLQGGEAIGLDEFLQGHDPITQEIIRQGGLFPFAKALAAGEAKVPHPDTGDRAMNMTEKLLGRHLVTDGTPFVKPGDPVLVEVDGGYSHDFTSAQVHYFLQEEYGEEYEIRNADRFAAFEDHLVYADEVPRFARFLGDIETMRELQRQFQSHSQVGDFLVRGDKSPGICHEVARETMVNPGDFIQATDSHTCMGGCNNALAWGVGATEYANLIYNGFTFVEVPEAIRFELVGELRPEVTAKDVMLFILLEFARPQKTLNRVMEFTGPGLRALSMDERATLANMATECSARGAIVEADEMTYRWIAARRDGADIEEMRARSVAPDRNAEYAGGVHVIDLSRIEPMVAHPGDPDHGIPSDPTNGEWIRDLPEVSIDIAYGGSCTAGKIDDLDFYHRVVAEALDAGRRVHPEVQFLIQFGSEMVEKYARDKGYVEDFERAGVQLIQPGCGACIGCGPGVSENAEQVSVSAINRNYKGRSGPGKLYLASPLSVAASAFAGYITAYSPGMFGDSVDLGAAS